MRVLLVEDDPVISQALQGILRAGPPGATLSNISVTAVATLAEALGMLARERYDVVLLDLSLPDSQGAPTFERILAAAEECAVVILTGTQDEALALEALRAGAQEYLIKGESGRNALVRALRHAIERKAATRAAQAGPKAAVDPELRRHLDILEAQHVVLRRLLSASGPAAAPPRLEPGATIGDRYELLEVMGRGASGITFRAHDQVLQRPRVLKALVGRQDGEASARRFLSEARLAATIEHPRVVGVRDFGLVGPTPYIVMDLVPGVTLAEKLEREGPLAPEKAAELFVQVLDGLEEIHRNGIIHRDLKPSNIMVSPTGATIIDFGLAREMKDPTIMGLSPVGPADGTLGYMSPEALERLPLSPASDVYAVGAMLFEALAGRSYLAGAGERRAEVERAILETPPTLPPEAHPELGRVAIVALEKDPMKRYGSAAAMRDAIFALKME